jgi:hypothetical protein
MGEVRDGFIFYNELELLEIRLYELAPVVDKFVLVEATHTHQGNEKPLYFDENKSWFNKYNIEHIIIPTKFPKNPTTQQVWDNEIWQRDHIADGFTNSREDIGMVSDVDEIPSREFVETLKKGRRIPLKLKQRMSYYFMNTVSPAMEWYGTVIAPCPVIKQVSCQTMRDCRHDPSMPSAESGWHFSYLGTPEFIVDKLKNFTHSEYNKPEYTNIDRVRELIGQGKDILGRGYTFEKIESDYWPHLVRDEPERFGKYFA